VTPIPPASRGLSWKLLILLVVIVAAAFGAWIFYRLETWPQRTTQEVLRAFREVAQIQPRITVHDRVFFEQTSPVLELAVVTRETTVEREMEHEWFGSKKRIKLRGSYNVRAGFDLTEPFSVRIDGAHISAQLPAPKILAIDPREVEVLVLENGLWNKIGPAELETELRALPAVARHKAFETGLTREALDIFTKRLRDQLGSSYELDVHAAGPPLN
jgi:Protein of unknown function (DUF4230)